MFAFGLTMALISGFLLALPALAQTQPDFLALTGRWFRTDGSYVIEIRSVDPGGRMQAAYYNPNPINVSAAQASSPGAAVTVFHRAARPRLPRLDLHANPRPEERPAQGHLPPCRPAEKLRGRICQGQMREMTPAGGPVTMAFQHVAQEGIIFPAQQGSRMNDQF
jgi:hypothetical protein